MSTATSPASAAAPATRKGLTLRNYLGYAAGDAANNLSFTMAGMFLMLYYTNVVGVEGAAIGTMFLVVRFVDAVTDLVGGRIVDMKKPGKFGKFRSLILMFSLPLLVSSWLIYSVKWFFPEISAGGGLIYVYLMYIIMGSVFYTLVNIPYGSMAPAMTQNPLERGKLASFRMYGTAASILVLAFVVAPQIKSSETPEQLQTALFWTTLGFVVLGMALYLFLVFNTEENVERDPEPVSLKDSLKTLAINRPLQMLAFSAVLFLMAQTGLSTLGAYIAMYVQDDANFIMWNQLANTLALFLIGPIVPKIVTTIGKRMGYMIMCGIMAVGGLMLAFLPLSSVPILGTVAFFVMGVGTFGVNTLMWALEADTVEYGEWKTGSRTEGTTYAAFSFTRKMGQALGGFVAGLALTWAGFNASAVADGAAVSDDVAASIQFYGGMLIIASSILAAVVMWFYPLSEQRFAEITEEITERRITQRPA